MAVTRAVCAAVAAAVLFKCGSDTHISSDASVADGGNGVVLGEPGYKYHAVRAPSATGTGLHVLGAMLTKTPLGPVIRRSIRAPHHHPPVTVISLLLLLVLSQRTHPRSTTSHTLRYLLDNNRVATLRELAAQSPNLIPLTTPILRMDPTSRAAYDANFAAAKHNGLDVDTVLKRGVSSNDEVGGSRIEAYHKAYACT